jgi:L-threonylcarbamoyladenylate synthase
VPDQPDILRAVALLREGRLVAFPTETVYGLGADARNERAIDLIFSTKGRPSTNPLIVHVASIDIAKRHVADWPDAAQTLAERFWPGPLTLVLPKACGISEKVTAGRNTVAIRVPNHSLALELLRAYDGPLAAPSANRSTHVSPTTAQHVRDEFPEQGQGEPALILDGGACTVGIESTVLDLTQTPPMILRPGHVTAQDLDPLIGRVGIYSGSVPKTQAQLSPGQQDVHYAPRTPATYFQGRFRNRTAASLLINLLKAKKPSPHVLLIGTDAHEKSYPASHPLRRSGRLVLMPNDPEQYARELYATLRAVDAQNPQMIYIELPPDLPEWRAVRDRIMRAARPFKTM